MTTVYPPFSLKATSTFKVLKDLVKIPSVNPRSHNIISIIKIFHRIAKIKQFHKTISIVVIKKYFLLTVSSIVDMKKFSFNQWYFPFRHTQIILFLP